MLKGKIIRVIDTPDLPKVKYGCRGEDNIDFVCTEKHWIYYAREMVFGEVKGCIITYDEKEDKIELMIEDLKED